MLLQHLLLAALTATTASAQYGLQKRTIHAKRQEPAPVGNGTAPGDAPSSSTPAMPALPDTHNFSVPINWKDESKGKFNNRYWLDDQAYEDGGPVIFQSMGEFAGEVGLMNLDETMALTIANKTRGVIVYFEHRYYGQSLPELDDPEIVNDPEKLGEWIGAGLSVDNALEDIAQFAKGFKLDGKDLSAGKVPWIVVGSSYSGSIAAWLRERNPEVAFAALASSAGLELTKEDQSFDQSIEDYSRQQYPNCTADLKEFMKWQNDIYESEDTEAFNGWLSAIGAGNKSELYTFFTQQANADSSLERAVSRAHNELLFREFLLYGPTDGQLPTFCDGLQARAIKANPELAKKIASDGVVAALGSWDKAQSLVFSTFKSMWADYMKAMGAAGGAQPPLKDLCASGSQQMCTTFLSLQAWAYQRCFELGNALTANGDDSAISPAFDNIEAARDECVDMFGESARAGPSLQPRKWTAESYSNTFFPDGAHDPWRGVSVNAESRGTSEEIPAAGKRARFGAVMPDSWHSAVFGCTAWLNRGDDKIDIKATEEWQVGDPNCGKDVQDAQQLFLDALDKWLPTFKPHSLTGGANSTTGGNSTLPAPGSPSAGSEVSGAGGHSGVPLLLAGVVAGVWGLLSGNNYN
ncbi:serine carboxypeptidase S28-domain-containing protein [Geopyxis carbonaria]|nr:serine carboxypeptidase S28-domain-containing protein [Geopyxis carbonaria]